MPRTALPVNGQTFVRFPTLNGSDVTMKKPSIVRALLALQICACRISMNRIDGTASRTT